MTKEEKQKAIDALKISAPVMVVTQEKFNDYIHTLNKVMDWLEQEPCEDAISRKALIERINHAEEKFKADNMESIGSDDGDPFVDGVLSGVFNIREMVIQAPSVTPQEPKTGHWIYDNFNWRCSECNETPKTMGYVGTADFMTEHFKFCNHCGARMIEPQESEVEDGNVD